MKNRVRLLILMSVFSFSTYAQQFKPDWYWSYIGEGIGVEILEGGDFNKDGKVEIITTGEGAGFNDPTSIYVVASDLNSIKCEADLGTLPFDSHFFQNDEDSQLEMLLVTKDNILTMDTRTCMIETHHTFENEITSAGFGDVNNNGTPDIAFSQDNNLYVSPWNNLDNFNIKKDFGGSKIIISSAGRNGGEDIGILSEDIMHILKGDDLTIIRQIDDNLTPMFEFGDVNGDGSYEVVQAVEWLVGVVVTNIEDGNVLFDKYYLNIDSMKLMDIDNDNKHEIIIGEAQWGSVEILNENGEITHSIENPDHGVNNVLIKDFGLGQGLEIVWATGFRTTGLDLLYRANVNDQSISWKSQLLVGSKYLSKPGNYLNNGQQYVALSYAVDGDTSIDGGGVMLINASTGLAAEQIYLSNDESRLYILDLTVGDIDNDGEKDLCFSGQASTRNFITCKNFITDEQKLSMWFQVDKIYQLELMDINNDSLSDIVAMSNEGIVSAYNPLNGFLRWKTEPFTNETISNGFDGIAQINNELWVFFESGNIYKLDTHDGEIIETYKNTMISKIYLNNDKVYAAKEGTGVGILNINTLDIDEIIYPTNEKLLYLHVSDDEKNLIVGSKKSGNMYQTTLVSSENLFNPVPIEYDIYNSIFTSNLDLLVSGNFGPIKYNLREFYDEIFVNGFE